MSMILYFHRTLFHYLCYRQFQSFDYTQSAVNPSAVPEPAGMYSSAPAFESSYISPAPQPYTGQFLNPNEAMYSAPEATSRSTDFDDEPPLLEGEPWTQFQSKHETHLL